MPNWKLPKKSKSCRYDFLIAKSFSWGAFQNPMVDENKKLPVQVAVM
jgi:hypothetical protein